MTALRFQVVPLSQRSGVLEWCQQTTQLGEYLRIAHKKHRPEDLTPAKAKEKLAVIQKEKTTVDEKVKVGLQSAPISSRLLSFSCLQKFNELCFHIRPVMRYFFHDRCFAPKLNPAWEFDFGSGSGGAYFERQQAYTRRYVLKDFP